MSNVSYGIGGSSYYDLARNGQLFCATATVTAPVIYTTAAGTGGPLLWNNTGSGAGGGNRVLAVLLSLGVGITTASGVAGAIGITGGTSTAPTTTTAIDGIDNLNLATAATPQCNLYRKGTVSTAGTFFMPTHQVTTVALTSAPPLSMMWFDLGGCFIVPPGSFASVSASATLTSGVFSVGLIFAEIPF